MAADARAVGMLRRNMRTSTLLFASLATLWLGACDEPATSAPQTQHVRVMTVERRVVSETVVLTGQIRAQDEITLAFRIDGKLGRVGRLVGKS
jgi:multidrug efflux pump subunit AcrA (membrane-fusion protein)